MVQHVRIGYLPILDHLILGVALAQDRELADHVVAVQFSNWADLEAAWDNDEVDGAFLLAPFVIDRFRRSPNARLVLLGHREGQTLLVRPEITAINQLKGQAIRLPDALSTHAVLVKQLLTESGLDAEHDVTFHYGAPALRTIVEHITVEQDAACLIAEPMATNARRRGTAVPLALSHDIAAHHIDCVLVVRESLLKTDSGRIQTIVTSLVRAGAFVNAYPRQAAEIGSDFLGWPTKLLLEALTHDEGHIIFWDLLPRLEDIEQLRDAAVATGVLPAENDDLARLVEPSFAREAYRDWVIDLRQTVRDRGLARTVPGTTGEAVRSLGSLIKRAVNVFQVPAGRSFPAGTKPVDAQSSLQVAIELLGASGIHFPAATSHQHLRTFARYTSEESVPTSEEICQKCVSAGQFKAIAMTPIDHPEQPDRLLLQLTGSGRERLVRAISFGASVTPPRVSDFPELANTTKPVVWLEDAGADWFSVEAKLAQLLPVLVAKFGGKY